MSSHSNGPAGSPRLVRSAEHETVQDTGDDFSESASGLGQHTSDSGYAFEPPTMGIQAAWWKILHGINRNANPPKPGKQEQQQRDDQEAARREAELVSYRLTTCANTENRMRALTDEITGFTVVYIGVKGAAATTTSMVNAASVLADVTRTTVYAADFNPASGTAGGRLGKNYDETISVRKFGELVEGYGKEGGMTRAEVNALLRPTKYGVRVLVADDYTLETTEQFGTRTKTMMDVLKQNCDYLQVDTPNDITTAAAKVMIERADVLVFTANVPERDSLRLLYTSMEKVRQIGFAEKVANSIVVISNVPESREVADYRKYLNRVDITHEVLQEIPESAFQGKFLGIPHDPVIALSGKVELEAYDWNTLQAYRELVIAEFEQAYDAAHAQTPKSGTTIALARPKEVS